MGRATVVTFVCFWRIFQGLIEKVDLANLPVFNKRFLFSEQTNTDDCWRLLFRASDGCFQHSRVHQIEAILNWLVATQIFFIFNLTWGNDPIWRAYFSRGLVQPPTRKLCQGNQLEVSFDGWEAQQGWPKVVGSIESEVQKWLPGTYFRFNPTFVLGISSDWRIVQVMLVMDRLAGDLQKKLLKPEMLRVFGRFFAFLPIYQVSVSD